MKIKLSSNLRTSQKQKTKRYLVVIAWTFSIAIVVSSLVFLTLNFGNIQQIFAGGGGSTYTSTATGGNWALGTTWTGNSAPGNWANNIVVLNGNIALTSSTTAINGFTSITLNNGKSFTSGTSVFGNDLSMQNVTFNVVNGSIVIYGNLTLSSSNITITAGNLNVTGTLTINSGSTVTVASGTSLKAASLSISNNSDAVLSNSGSVIINGNVSQGGVIDNNSGGLIQVNGDLTSTGSGSSVTTNAGNMSVGGNMTLPNSGKFYENPGGYLLVSNNVNVSSNLNLVVGTSASPLPYADMVIQKNLVASSSGDVLFDKNSRVAIFGNVTDSGGGGTLFTVNNGGEVYINGNITYSGGGNVVSNNNTVNPFGFYINGTITNSSGGSVTTSNKASRTVMQTTNLPFYTWVGLQPNSPLPIKLLYFKAASISPDGINLEWATAVEENFEKFVLERSADGKSYDVLTEIVGSGNSEKTLQYFFKDENPVSKKNYYRLKSVDLDGKFEYSNVLAVDFNDVKKLKIFPNPSNGEYINYSVNFEPESEVFIIYDLSGNKIGHYELNEKQGAITFDPPLGVGAYIVEFSAGSFTTKQRIVVQ